jgi:hypothetical protein
MFKKYRQNLNVHFIFINFFFQKSCRLRDNEEKYGKARQAMDDSISTAHVLCLLDN